MTENRLNQVLLFVFVIAVALAIILSATLEGERVVDLVSQWRALAAKSQTLVSPEISRKISDFLNRVFRKQDTPMMSFGNVFCVAHPGTDGPARMEPRKDRLPGRPEVLEDLRPLLDAGFDAQPVHSRSEIRLTQIPSILDDVIVRRAKKANKGTQQINWCECEDRFYTLNTICMSLKP